MNPQLPDQQDSQKCPPDLDELSKELLKTAQEERVSKEAETVLQSNIEVIRANVKLFADDRGALGGEWEKTLDQIESKLDCAEHDLEQQLETFEKLVAGVNEKLTDQSSQLRKWEEELTGSLPLSAIEAARAAAVAKGTFEALLFEALKTRLATAKKWLADASSSPKAGPALVYLRSAKDLLVSVAQCSDISCSPPWPLTFPQDAHAYETLLVESCLKLVKAKQAQVEQEFRLEFLKKLLADGLKAWADALARRQQDALDAVKDLPKDCPDSQQYQRRKMATW